MIEKKPLKTLFVSLTACGMAVLLSASAFAGLVLNGLPPEDIVRVEALLTRLEPLIKAREAEATLATLTFAELYAPLNEEEAQLLKAFQDLDAKELNVSIPFRGMATGEEHLIKIEGQRIMDKNAPDTELFEIGVQYLPEHAYEKYHAMMDAMEKDIGKRLLIESGYRSSAYQLYLFIFYLKNHDYSIRETVKFVALPGYSEHGSPKYQAIDFINEFGINGEYNPQEFEDLPEYAWLLERAGEFGFVLSYPKGEEGSGITYEPWHWRVEER
jgi:LAS superfamily LD-carboxypeptidase LdcB